MSNDKTPNGPDKDPRQGQKDSAGHHHHDHKGHTHKKGDLTKEAKERFCSFCGKSEHEVGKLLIGPNVNICDADIEHGMELLREREIEIAKEKARSATPTPKEIYDELNEYVIGQDDAKKTLSVAVHNHYKRLAHGEHAKNAGVEVAKSNILLTGPTGSGKTYLVETLARELGVPFAMADATALTQAGYVGEDVESMVAKLMQSADYDLEKAAHGIIYIDEVDKLGRRGSQGGGRDVSGEGVQQALLKMMEGNDVSVPAGASKQAGTKTLNTKNVLFIVGGAFAGIEDIIAARVGGQQEEKRGSTIGFTADIRPKEEFKRSSKSDLMQQLEPEDLHKFGMIPEFVGRTPVITATSELDENALIDILTKPKNALVKQYEYLFDLEDTKLTITDDGLHAIAQKAMKRGTGARGLRSIMEAALKEIMFELPGLDDVTEVVVNADVINGKAEAEFVRDGQPSITLPTPAKEQNSAPRPKYEVI